jgi:hypothetical protein
MDAPTRFLARFTQSLQPTVAILMVAKDLTSVIAAGHDVIDCSRIFDAQ